MYSEVMKLGALLLAAIGIAKIANAEVPTNWLSFAKVTAVEIQENLSPTLGAFKILSENLDGECVDQSIQKVHLASILSHSENMALQHVPKSRAELAALILYQFRMELTYSNTDEAKTAFCKLSDARGISDANGSGCSIFSKDITAFICPTTESQNISNLAWKLVPIPADIQRPLSCPKDFHNENGICVYDSEK